MEKFDLNAYNKFKEKMIRKAKKDGINENFGKKEIEALKNKYGYDPHGTIDEQVVCDIIDELEKWCNNLDINDIKCK